MGESFSGALGADIYSSLVPVQVGGSAHWRSVTSGPDHSCAVRDDDTLWCWGTNAYGALGNDRAWAQTPVPVLVP
jgi:alpha-tubulin suppressor-like RCC1 family protein